MPHLMQPTELKQLMDENIPLQLVDVRQEEELKIARIGGIHIPLHELPTRYVELDPELLTVVICHMGVRSARAAGLLLSLGFRDVRNLSGGIDLWSRSVDARVPVY